MAQAPCVGARARRVALQDGGELFGERVVAHFEAPHLVGIPVEGDDRGMAANRPMAVATSASEMPGATIASVACCTFPSPEKALMMPHTVPNRPDIRARRAHRGERCEALLEPVDLLELRDAHGAARAFEQLVGRCAVLLPLPRELAEAEFEDARHARGAAARLDAAIQLREVPARPEAVLELVGLGAARDGSPCACGR